MEFENLIDTGKIKYRGVYEIPYIEDKYLVEVYEKDDYVNFYLSNVKYGIKSEMFAVQKKDCNNEKRAKELIKNNIEDYIKIYREGFED